MLRRILPSGISAAGAVSTLPCFPPRSTAASRFAWGSVQAQTRYLPPWRCRSSCPATSWHCHTPKVTAGCRREAWGGLQGAPAQYAPKVASRYAENTHHNKHGLWGGGDIQNQCSPPARAALSPAGVWLLWETSEFGGKAKKALSVEARAGQDNSAQTLMCRHAEV